MLAFKAASSSSTLVPLHEDARRFLQEKATQEGKLSGLTEAYNLAHENAVNMRAMHDKLVDDVNTLNSRKEMIKGKMAVAKTQQRINKMTSSATNANNSMAAFDRMEAKANAELDKAKAMSELNRGAADGILDELLILPPRPLLPPLLRVVLPALPVSIPPLIYNKIGEPPRDPQTT